MTRLLSPRPFDRMLRPIKPIAALGVLATSAALSSFSAHAGDWIVGSGIYDITGPAADRGMVGYGSTAQTTQGIDTRLWSRAFTMGKAGTQDYVVFVSADLMSIPQGVHQGVMEKIAANGALAPYLNKNNVMLTATHTHVGPGGFDHNVMLNMSALGYDGKNHSTIVEGIYQSIVSAFNSQSEGDIKIAQGQLTGASVNRNTEAYHLNPDAADYPTNVNDTMTVLKLVKDNGQEVGMVNWFAVHNVSAPQTHRYISGDNKGVASQLFETEKGTQPPLTTGFVAAFANSDEGDVSPNVCGPENGCESSTEKNILRSANLQFNKAWSLYHSAQESLANTLDYRFQYVTLPGYEVSGQYTGNGSQTVCEGTLGWSMTAGAGWDGPMHIDGIQEGMTQDNEGAFWNANETLLGNVFAGYPLLGIMDALSNATNLFGSAGDTQHHECQYPKPTFLNTKLSNNIHLYTDTLPFQMFQLGKVLLVGVPGEITTMAGRRLKADLLNHMSARGVEQVIIAGLANAYGGYITTPEEFNVQHYAGGHTLYGPNSLAAYRQIYSLQAESMLAGSSVVPGPAPLDWSNDQLVNTIGVVYDDKRLWESFGGVKKNTASSYNKGQTAIVKFRSGHPQNHYRTMDAFMEVQRKVNGNWVTVYTENDISTRFRWIRDTDADCLACSYAQLEWTIPSDAPSGNYRLKHKGHWKSGWGGSLKSYTGKSRTFSVK